MQNETIVLYTEDKELIREVRRALVAKGFEDDISWNYQHDGDSKFKYLLIYDSGVMCLHSSKVALRYKQHHLSRTDLLTMFLLG